MGKTRKALLRVARDIVVIGVGVYLVLCVVLYFLQSRLLYYPDRDVSPTPKVLGLTFEDLTLTASDGVRINAWYVPAEAAAVTVLFCHGNAGNISGRLHTIQLVHELGANMLIFDYRGYWRSEGKPTEKGTYLDAEAAWAHLVKHRRAAPERIVLHGRSLGGAVAAHLARQHTPGGLILESTFSSLADMGQKLYPVFPVRWLCKFDYATAEYVRSAACPVLVIHSGEDDIVPFAQGRKVFAAAGEPKQFVKIRGSHNTGLLESEDLYRAALKQFLAKVATKGARR